MGANVLPIYNGKKPAMEWTILQTERQTIEQVQSYNWNNMTGIGIVCGVNGYTCIDIDMAVNDVTRQTVLRELGLEDTYSWQVKSGSGNGYHIWVTLNERLPLMNEKGVLKGNSKDGSFKQMEIRWKGCQTLIPPSSHASGNSYVWFHNEPNSQPSTVSAESILRAFDAVAMLDASIVDSAVPQFRRTNYVNILMNGVEEGKRNDTLASFAGHYRKMGMDYSEALVLLKKWNSGLTTPMPDDEVEKTVTSIYSYSTATIRVFNGAEMSMMAAPKTNDIVTGLIREQSINFIAGEEGAGKSLLSMNLGIAVATGLQNFLSYEIKKHGKVLYLNNELPFGEFLGRFKTMRGHLDNPAFTELENLIVPESVPPINDYWEELCRTIEKEVPILVILDCLYWAHDKKENDSSEMKTLMRRLVEMRDRFHIALIVVHHTKKGVRHESMHNDNMRGSQVFSASSDTVLQIRRSAKDESTRIFKPTKLRHGDDAMREPRLLSLVSANLWFVDEGIANEEEHLPKQNATPGNQTARTSIDWSGVFGNDNTLTRSEIIDRCKPLNISDRSIDRQLKEACEAYVLDKRSEGKYTIMRAIVASPISQAA